jgi:hypothetical protein
MYKLYVVEILKSKKECRCGKETIPPPSLHPQPVNKVRKSLVTSIWSSTHQIKVHYGKICFASEFFRNGFLPSPLT